MTTTPGDEVDPREGRLGQLSNEEWLAGHRFLQELVAGDEAFPDAELAYLFDPDRSAREVSVAELTLERDPAEPDVLPEPAKAEFQ